MLLVLYLLSSTDLLIQEERQKVYQVSVVLRDTNEAFYENFKKGVEQAAAELNVDINLLTLYDLQDVGQQADIIRAERQEGADALVLEPHGMELSKELVQDLPLVIVGDEEYEFAYSALEPDFAGAAELLAEQIRLRHPQLEEVYLFAHGRQNYGNAEAYAALEQIFAQTEVELRFIDDSEEKDAFRREIESFVYPDSAGNKERVALALDRPSFQKLLQIVEGSDVYKNSIGGIYGLGSSSYIVSKLHRGRVGGLVYWDDYKIGYLSVKTAVEMIEYRGTYQKLRIEGKFIDKEDLQEEENLRLLYPIE